jgi:hypothetical protein
VLVSQTPGDVALIAQQISQLLSTASQASQLSVTTSLTAPVPSTGTPTLELTSTSATINGFVPLGYEYVVTNGSAPATLAGSNPAPGLALNVLSGDAGGVYFLSGNSVDTPSVIFSGTQGNNTVVASGDYEIATGYATSSATGNAIFLTGTGSSGSVAAGDFSSISAAAGTTSQVTLQGSYDLIGVDGTASIYVGDGVGGTQVGAGNHAGIVGDTVGGVGAITATVDGGYATIGAGNDSQAVTLSGIDAIDFGGTSTNNLDVTGTGATLAGGAGPETITASVSTTLYAGVGNINFTASGGSATITGTSGSDVRFIGSSAGSFLYSAGAGNETLNATGTTTSNTLIFRDGWTGGTDNLTNVTASDTLYLLGYDPNQSVAYLIANATNTGSGETLHLSDNTRITFTDISTQSGLHNLNISYHPSV